jgi:Ca-activated chloride channel family protein
MNFFHILRPEYLLFLLPVWILVWWLLKQQNDEKHWEKMIQPKLLKYLLIQPKENYARVPAPWHLGLVLSLVALAISGPSWKVKESPFTKDDTKIALLVSVKKSMLTTDLQPNRLERAMIKMTDLLNQRPDTQASLIAYSGTAHLVLPLTKDHNILQTFAQALSPEIMPLAGDNILDALRLAQTELNEEGSTVIVLTDTLSPSLVKQAKEKKFVTSSNVVFWRIASDELSNARDFESSASLLDASYITYSRDDSDVKRVSSLIDRHFKKAAQNDKDEYEDGGYLLVPIIFVLLLFWSRQGFIAELWRRQ